MKLSERLSLVLSPLLALFFFLFFLFFLFFVFFFVMGFFREFSSLFFVCSLTMLIFTFPGPHGVEEKSMLEILGKCNPADLTTFRKKSLDIFSDDECCFEKWDSSHMKFLENEFLCFQVSISDIKLNIFIYYFIRIELQKIRRD